MKLIKSLLINSLLITILIIIFSSCKNNSSWEHSAALIIKGKEVKMSMYGSYHNAVLEWDKVQLILDKVAKTHSAKIVLIRVIPSKKEDEDLISNYVIRKVARYFDSLEVKYEIRDERGN